LAFGAGLILAGGVHTIKSVARPAVTATTGGTGNWAVSIIEDVLALIAAILSILMPILIGLAIIFGLILFIWWRTRRRFKMSAV
jgi:hypothetical protein